MKLRHADGRRAESLRPLVPAPGTIATEPTARCLRPGRLARRSASHPLACRVSRRSRRAAAATPGERQLEGPQQPAIAHRKSLARPKFRSASRRRLK